MTKVRQLKVTKGVKTRATEVTRMTASLKLPWSQVGNDGQDPR
jgi:hypothetical protein